MAKSTLRTTSFRLAQNSIEYLDDTYSASGANSKGEFLIKLLDKWNADDIPSDPEVKTITIEKELEPNQILLNLTPAQLFAIRSNVEGRPDFAEKQNQLIDSLKGDRPFLYFGNLYDPEFKSLWVRNIVITKEMTSIKKENATQHNMTAFLINMYLMHAIDGNLSASNVSAASIKSFIQKQAAKEELNNKQKPISNESYNKKSVPFN